MPKVRFEGRAIHKKVANGFFINPFRKPVFFISNKLISNLTEGSPVNGCDGWVEFEVPEWLMNKQESLEHYRV